MSTIPQNKKHLWALFAILLLASALRFYKLAEIPSGFFCDEAVTANQANSLVQTGRDLYGEPWPMLIDCYHKVFLEPVYTYGEALVFKFRGMDIFGARSVSAFAGVIAVLGAYLLVQYLWGWAPALAAAMLVAVSPWQLPLSRLAFHGTLVCAVMTLALYFFYRGLKRPGFLIACAFMLALGPYAYSPLKLFMPIVVLTLLIAYRRELGAMRRAGGWGRGCLYASVFVLTLVAWPMYFLSVWGPGNARFNDISIFSDDHPWLAAYRVFLHHISSDFLFLRGDSNLRHHSGFGGQIFWTLVPVLVFSVFEAVRRKDKEALLFCLLFFLGFLPVALTKAEEGVALRGVSAAPFIELIAAYGFFRLFEILRERKIFPHPWFVGLGVLIGINAAALVGHYFTVFPAKSQEFFQYGIGEAVEYGLAHQEEYDRIYLTHQTGEGDTLLLFFAKIRPADYQKTRSKGKFVYCSPDTAACLAEPGKNLYILTPQEAFPDRIKEYQGHKVMVLQPGDLDADNIKHLVLDARKALSYVVCTKPADRSIAEAFDATL